MFGNNGDGGGGGPQLPQLPQTPTTKISIFIISTMVVVSFLGLLPNFTPYLVLSPSAFSLPFPKFWVLFTGIFYYDSIFYGFLNGIFILYFAKYLEPMFGSKEFLRIYLMIGFYTNILVLIFAGIMIIITDDGLIAIRPFVTSGAPMSAYMMYLAHELIDVKIPTICGRARMRMIPFYTFVFTLIFALIGRCDSLLSSLFGNVLTYLYLRYIKKNGPNRGDPSFSIFKLLPTCDFSSTEDDDDDDNNNDGGATNGGGGIMGMQQQQQQMGPEGGMERFTLDNNPTPNRRNNNNNNNRQNMFQGRPHTLGD